MSCDHEGFHTFRSQYDHRRGMLVYLRICERCRRPLGVVRREPYRPHYDPHGHEGHLSRSSRPAA